MKKVYIVTECNKYVPNFGETLQAVALNRVISQLGFITITLSPDSEKLEFELGDIIRAYRFERFRKKNIRNTILRTNDIKEMEKITADAEYIVCGSDCIWNEISIKDYYFLNFHSNGKKIAYAPSLRDSIVVSSRYKKNIKNWINDISYLSTRETEGSRLISEFTGRDCATVIDPTLLIPTDEWKLMMYRKRLIRKRYILVYFIGKWDILKEYIAPIKRSFGCETLVYIDECNRVIYEDGEPAEIKGPIGPAEFMALIYGAEAILTDSFHGTAFSINFNKPFMSFQRIGNRKIMYDYDCRITNILNLLGIDGHFVNRKGQNKTLDMIDYSFVNDRLNEERERSLGFLRIALDLQCE
ncbi:MAG: polysaccharide pyruvyl transferase family protein [Lachnospiraceae bacterium]|nr:polysaccharide pyruvyl transferase family protein [Lachnospiraceae bacterium]